MCYFLQLRLGRGGIGGRGGGGGGGGGCVAEKGEEDDDDGNDDNIFVMSKLFPPQYIGLCNSLHCVCNIYVEFA